VRTGLKRLLRPAAQRWRRIVANVGQRVRPLRPWDGRHHPVLERFEPWSGEADGTFLYDSLGVRTDPRFRPQFAPQARGPLVTRHPAPHAGYFELVFVLDSVLAAGGQDRFTMLELGAGYGYWLVTAYRAMQASAGLPVRLVGVELVPQHFAWMREHFRNNGLDPDAHRLIHAAVSDREGEGAYEPEGDPDAAFGQRLGARPGDPVRGRGVRVPTIRLSALLDDLDRVDLVHIDVQGEERRVLPEAIDALNHKVRRLIFATHSRSTHRRLRRLLAEAGWSGVYDYGVRRRVRTEFGDVRFLDGLQAWINPALEGGPPIGGPSAERPEPRGAAV